jgi:hypothetical protein
MEICVCKAVQPDLDVHAGQAQAGVSEARSPDGTPDAGPSIPSGLETV